MSTNIPSEGARGDQCHKTSVSQCGDNTQGEQKRLQEDMTRELSLKGRIDACQIDNRQGT